MARPQANVALTAEEYDLLIALTFVEEASATEVLHPLVAEFLDAKSREPEVRKALEALRQRRATKQSGRLSSLRDRMRKDAEQT